MKEASFCLDHVRGCLKKLELNVVCLIQASRVQCEICFQLNLIQKIFMGLSEQILPLHIIASRATCRVSKQPGSILAGKGAEFKIFFSNELSFRAINRRVNTIWGLYIRGGGEMIVLRFSFSTRVPFYGVSLCPYSKFHVGRGMLPFLFFSFQG